MPNMETVHIIPHSHWDREWYMSFEEHRYRLIDLIDSILEETEASQEFRSFNLDGQMVVLEDYLQIKPYNFDRLKHAIDTGRIKVGPWYVLQDEYLISDEANVRNMLIGLQVAEKMNVKPQMVGYLPDSFGNIAQMPQIFCGFGIDCAVFGRGVPAISELIWGSPDGSRVVAAHFAPWYNNAAELPVESTAVQARAEKLLGNFRKASAIHDYLGMNGSDHQPLQRNLPEAIAAFNQLDPSVQYIQSDLETYMQIVKKDTSKYPVIVEELAGQHTNGKGLLICTASARIYLKQLNRLAENALEREAEPLSAMASLYGGIYDKDYLFYAWKQLLKNHAHDSICGCSVDPVHRDMETRFGEVLKAAGCITARAVERLESHLKVDCTKGIPVAVYNTSVYDRTDLVTVTVDVPVESGKTVSALTDEAGTVVAVPAKVEKNVFTYTLPDDAFRKVVYVDRYTFTFSAQAVPACGYKIYYATNATDASSALKHTDRSAENEYLHVDIENNGSLTVTDLETGRVVSGINLYEDMADIGDEYKFIRYDRPAVTTENAVAGVELKCATSSAVTFIIRHTLQLPKYFDRSEIRFSDETTPVEIETEVTLTKGSRRLDFAVKIENGAENHRIRALFKNDIKTETVLVGGQYDTLHRSIATDSVWTAPSNEQIMLNFAALKDADAHLLVATRGLHEYEVLRDGSNTLCVTLLRCIDQLGDWGYFPTPDAQCKNRVNTAEYALFFGKAENYESAEMQALQYTAGTMPAKQITDPQCCDGSAEYSLCRMETNGLWNTAFKNAEKGSGLVLRVYNTGTEERHAVLRLSDRFVEAQLLNLAEEPTGTSYPVVGGAVSLDVPAHRIVTLLLKTRE